MLKIVFGNLRWLLAFSLVLAALSFPIMTRVWFDYLTGGNDWRQADWLINFGSGPVRRGLMGEAFIMFSDLIGGSLLVLVLVFQSLLFVALVFIVWVIGLMHGNRRLLLFLAASPAFFLIFWAGAPQGIMRKELFGLLALALLAFGSVSAGRYPLYSTMAVGLYTLGSIGNSLHAFMAPAMVAGLYLAQQGGQISGWLFRILAGFVLVMGVVWLGLAIWFREVAELAGMCAPLIARGLDEGFCSGALSWMVAGYTDPLAELLKLMTPSALARFLAITALSLVPVVLSYFVFRERRFLNLLLLTTFLPMLLLYPVATDWGRWLSISYTAYVFLVLQAHATGKLTIATLPPTRVLAPLLGAALLISPALDIGWKPGGAIYSLIISVADYF